MALVGGLPFTNNPVPSYKGRKPVISSGFRASDRPDHIGSDFSYRRLPEDGGPPGKALEPSWAPRYYHPQGLLAMAAGPGRVTVSEPIGTGETVNIDHGGGWVSQYMHMRNRRVKVGDQVSGGQPIGTISFNPKDWNFIHLHFQVRKDGALMDPGPIVANLPVLSEPATMPWIWIAAAAAFGGALYWYFRRASW